MANIQPVNDGQAITDDQELAKVLAGVTDDVNIAAAAAVPASDPITEVEAENLAADPIEAPIVDPLASEPAVPADSENLDGVKKEAIVELRPLVDKLDLPPEEKFDTYLLLLRSTDDKSLIAPAHEAAKLIEDEAHRAQALLDIIKEIDYLSAPATPPAS